MITFRIDEIIPCLKDAETGEIFETEVVRLRRKSFLSKFNSRTGWYVNWSKFNKNTEVYALVLCGTVDIQGLIAVENNDEAKALHIVWASTAPHNNIWQYHKQKYIGVGGHLFAIAAELSEKRGYEGFLYGEAMDRELYEYYMDKFNALPLPKTTHPYPIMFTSASTKRIREVYNYEWSNEVL